MANDRFRARRALIEDESLSAASKALYMALDDCAGPKGECFPSLAWLQRKLHRCERQIRRYRSELEDAGYVKVRRRMGEKSVYILVWAQLASVRTQVSDQSGHGCPHGPDTGVRTIPYIQNQSVLTNRSTRCHCGEFHEGPERRRCRCGSVHDPDRAEVVDPLEETRRLLSGYVHQVGLGWDEPDEEICRRTLEAAGGLVTLVARLRTLLLDRRLAPRESYGWFPVAVGKSRRTA